MRGFRIFWLIVVIIAILEVVTPLAYTSSYVSYIFQSIALVGFLFIVLKDKDNVKRLYSVVFAVYFIVSSGSFFIGFFSFGSSYKVQTITHRHQKIKNYRIEYLWSDVGALGYNKTTELVFPLTPLFEWRIKNFAVDDLNSGFWEEVNEDVNELGLKGG
jgi:hypothetical protein